MKEQQQNESIGMLFIEICKRRRNKKNELLSEANLYEGQDILLHYLAIADGQTMSELAAKVCVQAATLSTMIRRMEANGLIRKEADPHDKRAHRIYFTAKGREVQALTCRIWSELDKRTLKDLSADEKKLLDQLLKKVLKNLA
ncbi:MarR family winged helix-turn-helix transcriptional regulator [uncultured Chitinophaga sp.]|uniref:MarR family winged helix-turn-helix transcriptional regulator n=1 Tax=uncultured Chitinophaga sp. TaxID=339340 RepID=UPI00261BE234|nr:MarR family winged helix-turn-helix transcriptional regulator [uncultured Chitinophaga sp.]